MSDSTGWLAGVPGVLEAEQLATTVGLLADWQLGDGMMPWYPGGHSDPWNHVEALMALMLGGRRQAAEAGYDWLSGLQHPDGSWHQYYLAGGEVEEEKFDANCVAYVATGLYFHWLLFEDRDFLARHWQLLCGAVEFVRGLQTDRGEVFWARKPDGSAFEFALLTGSSSICHSLRCAVAVAEVLGEDRPGWVAAAQALGRVIREEPEAFAPKHRWAMDWYYPVLTGVEAGERGRHRLDARRAAFVMEDRGVRCVSDRPWVTAAETCECAMAHLAVGEEQVAADMFAWAQRLRTEEGHYWTGIVYPQEDYFPADERSTYSSAAVVLAADALTQASPASWLFTDHARLPAGPPSPP
ncbi:MAG: hypothetical protein R2754_09205 [Microthrixaceae bacterium]